MAGGEEAVTVPHACRGQHVLVLAAGQGRRMGGPKLFAHHRGRGFLERILTRCRESASLVTLVTDPRHSDGLESLMAALPAALLAPVPRVVHADGEADMLASVRAALRAGPYEPGYWLWPVDAPFISAAGWARAVQTAGRDPNVIWKLRVGGRTGHPIWYPFHTARAILSGDWPDGLRGYLATVPPERIQVLELPGEYLEDVDTPQQLAGLGWLD